MKDYHHQNGIKLGGYYYIDLRLMHSMCKLASSSDLLVAKPISI